MRLPVVLLAGAVLAHAALAAACIPLPGRRSAVARTVSGKRGEDVLVAAGGWWCRVGAATFARVQLGDRHRCAWEAADAAEPGGTGRAVPDARPGRTRLPARPSDPERPS
jgi:hypothetical protein